MKKTIFTLFFAFIGVFCCAQALKVTPQFPSAEGQITLTFNLDDAKDSRKNGLLNKTSGLYIWAWGGSDINNKVSEFGPDGQTSFSSAYAPGSLTHVAGNTWSISLTPNQYLTIPSGKTLRWMGILVKNADGSAQTEDFVVDLFEQNQLWVQFKKPVSEQFFVAPNEIIPVQASASKRSELTISVDGKMIISKVDTLISAEINAGLSDNKRHTVEVTAILEGQSAKDSFSYIVAPTPRVANLPAGVKNGINYTSATSVTLVLYAPDKKFIYVLGEFNNWQEDAGFIMNRTPDGDTYWLEINNLVAQQEYPFQYFVDGEIAVGDPYSEKILDRNNDQYIPSVNYPNLLPFPKNAKGDIVSVLQTNQVKYAWQTANFERPQAENLVIYELLVRDFTSTHWYETMADTLTYLKKLGINAIELMPVMEFAGNDSWGYNPIYYMAPDKAYGTATDLKKFVDKCHQQGIAVLLDMVLNQADYEFPYVKMYWNGTQPAANSPMFNPQATHPYSVFFDFNHESPATQKYVKEVTDFWLKEYRFDGFRFDLSKGFTQKKSENNVAAWGEYDASRVAIWKRIYNGIKTVDSSAYVILEHFGSDQEEAELTNSGMLVWDNQNGAFREGIKNGGGNFNRLSWKNHKGFQFVRAIGYMESHDEERLLYDAVTNGGIGNGYSAKVLTNALERAKALAAFGILTPGPKMIWQFGELGYDISIDENGRTGTKPIKWNYQQDADRQKLFQVYAALIHLKLNQTIFQSTDFDLNAGDNSVKKLFVQDKTSSLWVIANLGLNDTKVTLPSGQWYDYFTGDDIRDLGEVTFKPAQFHILTSVKMEKPKVQPVSWKLQVVTGIESEHYESPLFYPNPATENIHLKHSSSYRGPVKVEIINSSGNSMQSTAFTKDVPTLEEVLSIEKLKSGLYYMVLQEGNEVLVGKLIKE